MSALILAAALAAVPQHSMPGMSMPMACTPQHAAMGHCKMPAAKPKPRPAPKTRPKAKPLAKPKASAKRAAVPKRGAVVSRETPAVSAPASTCSADHAAMGHCTMPAPAPAPAPVAAPPACTPEHAAMGHCAMPAPAAPGGGDAACPPEHAAMGHCTPATRNEVGNAPAPAAFPDLAASSFYGEEAMTAASDALRREHGGMAFNQVMLNLAEIAVRDGRDGYRWDGEAWFGGDIDRLVLKSEGEGRFGDRLDEAEVQALWSRAVGPYENVQLGIRQDLGAGARRTYASAGFEALAPYWFDVEATAFLSDKGELFGRAEAYVDQRLTNWWVLQPRVEVELSAQDVPALRLGSGVTRAEAGLRLRYEWKREFAPYVGVSWERRFGDTARFARADGEGTGGFAFVAGLRAWF